MKYLRQLVAAPFVLVGVLLLAIGSLIIYGFNNSINILEDISVVYEGYDH